MFESGDFSSEIEYFAQNLAVGLNGKFCLDKRKFWSKWLKKSFEYSFCLKKIEICRQFFWKSWKFSKILLKKIDFFYLDPWPDQISNQIDAAALNYSCIIVFT